MSKNSIRTIFLAGNMILGMVVLSGCSQEVTDHNISITIDTNTYDGLYTGMLSDGKPSGQAKFVVKIDDTSNWVYSGGFSDGVFSGEGTVEMYPCKVKIGVQNDEGIYSGEVNGGIINGKGTYSSALGWSYVGDFKDGAIKGEGEVKAFPFKLSYENKTVEGNYEGAVIDGIPNGKGNFEGEVESTKIRYEGEWTDGALSGEGSLKSSSYTVPFADGAERTGEYEGTTFDGRADGDGIFTATNTNGDKYTYTGEFKEGTFEGIGTIDFENEDITDYTGHFAKGMNTPTKSELIVYLGTIKSFIEYDVIDDSVKFIDTHEKLFMADNPESLEPFINTEITLNELYKTPHEYSDEIFTVSTKNITQIRQEDLFDKTITWFITDDKNYNRIFVVCDGKLPEVNKNDKVKVYGLPIGIGSYKNAFNSVMNAYVIYGCYVSK
ncbi:hypothetical protein [Butyrivibrio sp. XPD2006]|uniref:hypothetical protein n=1 Tax=Butyrivibrio sp. XPD2006 TaxID=1280668 RepID=UPI0003B7163C|nr:hypothetical protein [Butyrivibrio sp. XPD2006]